MNREEILNGNKLMAEYIGYKYFPHTAPYKRNGENISGWVRPRSHSISPNFYLCRSHNDLSFDTNWSMLMRVIERIERDSVVVSIVGTVSAIHNFEITFSTCIGPTKILSVWTTCLSYIKKQNT